MAIKTKNFVFGDDFRDKSFPDFKAYMKDVHKVSAKKAREIYNEIHGKSVSVPEESSEA